MPNERPDTLDDILTGLNPVDATAAEQAAEHHAGLAKPPGSLGGLEAIGIRLAAIAGSTIPPAPEPAAIAVCAGDHGVLAEGVTPWPKEITAVMTSTFLAGGAAINAITAANGIELFVVNAGIADPLPADVSAHPNLLDTPVRAGSSNLRVEAALGLADATASVMLGITTGRRLIDDGARCLLTGDMGIGNTTPSAATIAALTGVGPDDAAIVTGRGTGVDDETLALKTTVIADALRRIEGGAVSGSPEALRVLAEVGGLEIGAIAGLCIAGAEARVPVIVDGVISLAGATIAATLSPVVTGYLIAGHRSTEPAASRALEHLGLDPILDLDLRLGEGTGGALAYPIVKSAARVMADMATIASLM